MKDSFLFYRIVDKRGGNIKCTKRFHLETIPVSILGIAVAIAGLALYFLARKWVNNRFNLEVESIEDKMKVFLSDNPPMFRANAKGVLLSPNNIAETSTAYMHEYQIIGLKDFSKEDVIYIDAYYIQGEKKVAIDDFNIHLMDLGVKVIIVESQ